MTAVRRRDLFVAADVAAALIAVTALIAAAVHFFAAGWMRTMLDFGFEGVPHTIGSATEIFLANSRVLAAVLVAGVALQIGRTAADSGPARIIARVIVSVCDGALLVACALHVLLVGAAFGAYGGRTIVPTLLHGTFELAGFSVGLALYLAARREALSTRRFAATALTAVALLAVAALFEAFTNA
jgi:hypothetical protein